MLPVVFFVDLEDFGLEMESGLSTKRVLFIYLNVVMMTLQYKHPNSTASRKDITNSTQTTTTTSGHNGAESFEDSR